MHSSNRRQTHWTMKPKLVQVWRLPFSKQEQILPKSTRHQRHKKDRQRLTAFTRTHMADLPHYHFGRVYGARICQRHLIAQQSEVDYSREFEIDRSRVTSHGLKGIHAFFIHRLPDWNSLQVFTILVFDVWRSLFVAAAYSNRSCLEVIWTGLRVCLENKARIFRM